MQDSQEPNPLIRALAVRTMGCIRVDKITEYLCDPLQRCLKVSPFALAVYKRCSWPLRSCQANHVDAQHAVAPHNYAAVICFCISDPEHRNWGGMQAQ